MRPAFDLYNRNFVVAAPTFVGNAICGAPFFLIAGGADALISGEKSETYYNVINGIYLVPATICGFATGTAFIPFSFICEEDPWDFGFQLGRVNWNCLKSD